MFHRVVALSHRTTDETMKAATASVYASLTPSQKARLPGVQQFHDECQQSLFTHHLLREGIAPHTTPTLPDAVNFSMDLLRGLALADIQFVITGARQSGKSTLLHDLSTVVCRKLQVSSEASQWLFFPINFEIWTTHLTNPNRLLRLFLSTSFQALTYSSLNLLPYLDSLQRWFTLVAFGAALTPPQELTNCPFLRISELTTLAKSLNSQPKTIAEFPNVFAQTLGLRGAIFIIDGFDLATVELTDALSLALNESPYVIAVKSEQQFLRCFAGNSAAMITTDGIIKEVREPVIIVRNPALTVKVEDCGGCPGFVVAFRRLVERVKAYLENAAYASQYSSVNTAADLSRAKLVKQELVHFVTLLVEAGVEGYGREIINELMESNEMVVKLGPLPEEPKKAERKF
jgi:hypothetical protein